MITKEERIERICSFYVSDFHLEMMMLPYINKKLDENANIMILTQKNLEESMQVLIKKLNLSEQKRKIISELNWKNHSVITFTKLNPKQEQILFIIGDEKYRGQVNKIVEQITGNVKIINCYELEKIENKIDQITKEHDKILNTMGEKTI